MTFEKTSLESQQKMDKMFFDFKKVGENWKSIAKLEKDSQI